MHKKLITAIVGTSALTVMASAQMEAAQQYRVQSGDSLWSIATKHNISIATLKSLNNLSSNLIFPNQMLKVSGSAQATTKKKVKVAQQSTGGSTYTVQAGDSLSLIASKYGTTYQNIMKLNGLNDFFIYPGQKLKVSGNASTTTTRVKKVKKKTSAPAQQGSTYTVQAGDSLSLIASKYGTTYQNIMKLNGLNDFFIYPGQKLKVSGQAPAQPKPAKKPARPATQTTQQGSTYTVQPGDSLSLIASKYGTTYQNIMTLNGLNDFFIYPGQKLKVSGTVSTNTQTPKVNKPAQVKTQSGYFTPTFNHSNLYDWGQCTWYVFNKRQEIGKPISTYWWNANNWANGASQDGYTVDNRPEVGSILQSTAGYYGHVAFVEQIRPDGSLLVSEMNFTGSPGIVTYRTVTASQIANYRFIH